MNQKIFFNSTITIIVIVVIVTGICFSITKRVCSAPFSNESDGVANAQNYYAALTKECKKKQSKSCCLASVKAMKKGNYTLVPQEGCPAGYQPNGLLCIDSYGWCQPISTSSTPRPAKREVNDPIDGIEDGGYSGTAFCSVMRHADFELEGRWLTILGKGPYTVRINKMRIVFSPYEYPNVKLISHIRFEDKKNTYADSLYIGDDNNLYNCHGGK